MAPPLIYVSRLVRLPLLGADGIPIGHLDDVVLSPPGGPESPPRALGFVATVQRRKIFVNANRVGELDNAGARMQTGTVDLRRFQLRPGEVLAKTGIFDKKVGTLVVHDIALVATTEPPGWQVASLSLGSGGLLRRRRADKVVPWTE